MRQIVIDTETTGLEPEKGHRIIEIGCIELLDRQVTSRNFHKYINPQRRIEEEALAIHGITNEFLRDKPTFASIALAFSVALSGDKPPIKSGMQTFSSAVNSGNK